jgi:chromosome segregation ATPase
LEVINDLFRGRVSELEHNEQEYRQRESAREEEAQRLTAELAAAVARAAELQRRVDDLLQLRHRREEVTADLQRSVDDIMHLRHVREERNGAHTEDGAKGGEETDEGTDQEKDGDDDEGPARKRIRTEKDSDVDTIAEFDSAHATPRTPS